MNALPAGSIVLLDISGRRAVAVVRDSQSATNALANLGFALKGEYLVRPIPDEDDRLTLIRELMKLKALFSGGTGWSPYDVVAFLHDEGKLEGPYAAIAWTDPATFEVRDYKG